MSIWQGLGWITIAVLGGRMIVGLHRQALRLEEQGRLYYVRNRPKGGGGGFVALQRIIEPSSEHIFIVSESSDHKPNDGEPGEPPPVVSRDRLNRRDE